MEYGEKTLGSAYSACMYCPEQETLRKYADLLVKFALDGGRGARRGSVVQAHVPDVAKPLLSELQRAILEVGAYPKLHLIPTGMEKSFFAHANDDQLTFFPKRYKRAEADLLDHQISILAETDPRELQDVDPARIFAAMDARKKYREWLFEKEHKGKFSWTLALYGTEQMAAEAGMSIEEYWGHIIAACYLDMPDPMAEWRKIQEEQDRIKNTLNALAIERLHVESKNIDLWVAVGKRRQWLGGSGRNIPSYEIFVSPDWRGTEGRVRFNEPLYRYGNILHGVELAFKKGRVTEATAKQGQRVLESMLARKNADKIGEFSLTDARFSRITVPMANTLYDENMGGRYGNMHIAVGKAYKESYDGDMASVKRSEWNALGFNDSPEHTDIISTEDKTVTAYTGAEKRVIFSEGKFTV